MFVEMNHHSGTRSPGTQNCPDNIGHCESRWPGAKESRPPRQIAAKRNLRFLLLFPLIRADQPLLYPRRCLDQHQNIHEQIHFSYR